MKTCDQLTNLALQTQDPAVLFSLFEQAISLARFNTSQAEFSKVREAALKVQVERQTKMIENLEKTLWKK